MQKVTTLLLGVLLVVCSCRRTELAENLQPATPPETTTQRTCAAHDVLEQQIAADPERGKRLQDYENKVKKYRTGTSSRLINGKLIIPVVVNVLWRTKAENISDDQIRSQLEVLNADFNHLNTDRNGLALPFDDGAAMEVEFVIENWRRDVNRKQTKKTSWTMNEDMKKTARGGIDPTNPEQKLNIWVVGQLLNGTSVILGYGQFPGGPLATDGVVIGHQYFGSRGTLAPPYHLGRTATHEVGHWMGLRHIWGSTNSCASDDEVADTPNQSKANFGCPSFPQIDNCLTNPEGAMFMNFMDYTNDGCMYMFTPGQVTRMQATFFAENAPRKTFLQ